jgi:hypothetical protein
MEIWVDKVKVYAVAKNSLDTNLTMSSGTRRLVVVAAESDTSDFKQMEYVRFQQAQQVRHTRVRRCLTCSRPLISLLVFRRD